MKVSLKNFFLILIIMCFNACTSNSLRDVIGSAVAHGADTQVKYTPYECSVLQQRCVQGDYQEWQTSEKEIGCSCKKL